MRFFGVPVHSFNIELTNRCTLACPECARTGNPWVRANLTDLPVELDIYDGSGRLIRTLLSGRLEDPVRIIEWDARDDAGTAVASGVYFMRARQDEWTVTRRLIVLR